MRSSHASVEYFSQTGSRRRLARSAVRLPPYEEFFKTRTNNPHCTATAARPLEDSSSPITARLSVQSFKIGTDCFP